MKKILIVLGIAGLGLMSSCINGEKGEANYTYLRGKQGILILNSETGDVYRMKLNQNGTSEWIYLGSPEKAKK